MHDETGDGWLRHMVHGTAKSLQAYGPLACREGPGHSFFQQARIFEASRALLLSEPTFLSNPEWEDLTGPFASGKRLCSESPLDAILSIIVKCSKLRLRYVTRINDFHLISSHG